MLLYNISVNSQLYSIITTHAGEGPRGVKTLCYSTTSLLTPSSILSLLHMLGRDSGGSRPSATLQHLCELPALFYHYYTCWGGTQGGQDPLLLYNISVNSQLYSIITTHAGEGLRAVKTLCYSTTSLLTPNFIHLLLYMLGRGPEGLRPFSTLQHLLTPRSILSLLHMLGRGPGGSRPSSTLQHLC